MLTNQNLSELLVLFLLAIVCLRFLFIRKIKNDTLAVVAFVAFGIAILNIFAFGLSFSEMAIFVISFFVSLWNVRAFIRLFSGLVIDRFGFLSIISSIINFVLVVFATVNVIRYRTPVVDEKKYSVQKTEINYVESKYEESGFEKAGPNEQPDVTVWKIQGAYNGVVKTTESNNVILFIPPKCSDLNIYKSFLYKLAKDGFVVYAAEFYNDGEWLGKPADFRFCQKDLLRSLRVKDEDEYLAIYESKKSARVNSCRQLLNIVNPGKEKKVCLVLDDELDVIGEVYSKYMIGENRVFDLASVREYQTSGFGPVENTDLIFSKKLNIPGDRSFYMSSHLATCLEKLVYYPHE